MNLTNGVAAGTLCDKQMDMQRQIYIELIHYLNQPAEIFSTVMVFTSFVNFCNFMSKESPAFKIGLKLKHCRRSNKKIIDSKWWQHRNQS